MHILLSVIFMFVVLVFPFGVGEHVVLKREEVPQVEVLFVGDVMLDRYIRTLGERHGYEWLFSCTREVLEEHDFVVGNLEGPVTTYPSESQGKGEGEAGNTRFTFAPEAAEVLSKYFDFVSLGNNHIYDYGGEGVSMTRTFLDTYGVGYVGDPTDIANIGRTVTVEGVPITFVAYNAFFGDIRDTIATVQEAEGTVVVLAHWGEEYVEATEEQRAFARTLIAAGADLVVGSHPHVVQESEMIEGKWVYYSLGNFIFDQYFSPAVMEGLGLSVVVSERGILQVAPIPFVLDAMLRPCPVQTEGIVLSRLQQQGSSQ